MKINIWYGKMFGLGFQYDWFSLRWLGISLPFITIYFLFDELPTDGKFIEFNNYISMEQ